MKTIEDYASQIDRIAVANGDEFSINIKIDKKRRGLGGYRWHYFIEVIETADGHNFAGSNGETLEAAVASAFAELEDDCLRWNYVYVS